VLYLFVWVVVRGALRGFGTHTAAAAAAVRPSQPAALVLTVLEPGESNLESGARIGVQRAPAVIGRAVSADVIVADAAVSAQHARLDWTDDAWVVLDLDSTNGTRLNARAVHGPTRLRPGDTLEVGPVRFAVSDT
ncbi:MAG TPA: FHA domain-containing protein, partial [Chloroflexota bacterium]|nr:FHA domain-containing protein [Chloroflexota bacterium]